MAQKFLLQEVIDDLVNVEKSISSSLIKLHYFGKLIKNEELIKYTDRELNGYGIQDEVPNYRRTPGTIMVNLQAGYNVHNGLPLPTSMLREPYCTELKYYEVRQGITSIESLASKINKSDKGDLQKTFPMEMLHAFQEPAAKSYKSDISIVVTGAYMQANSYILLEIPNAIRTRLLDFVMSIAETFGYSIEIESFNKKSSDHNQTIVKHMTNIINNTGNGNVINTGNQNEIRNEATFYKGDLARLQSELKKQGIEDEDIKEISEIVVSEQPNLETGALGEKSKTWIMKILGKSLEGIGKIATGISANLLATIIKCYYGI